MAALPEDMSVAIDELETAIADIESRLETARAERDEAKGRQVELEIENANLRRELILARERQGASADIIGAIASAPGNAAQVLQQIAETTARLFGAPSVSIQLAENGEWASAYRFGDSAIRVRSAVPIDTIRIGGPNLPGTVIAENRQIHIPDLDDLDPAIAHWPGPPIARATGTRVMCGTPLRRAETAIGVLVVYRDRPLPFTAEELTLLQSFADQAVIAIENARLFNETGESLERQTATADILKVIASSPSDVQPVFEAIASSAKRLLGGFTATVLHFRGDQLHLVAFTPTSPEADEGLKASFPLPVADFAIFALVRDGATLQFPDTEAENVPPMNRELGRLRGFRSVLFVPLMNQGNAVGILSVTRTEPGAFAAHHLQLLQTFADQAVIAIENTRLFNETQEALERQTATAEILRVIASSPSDVQPVFDAIAHSARRLIGGFSTAVHRIIDDVDHLVAFTPTNPESDEILKAAFPRPRSELPAIISLVEEGETAQITDSEAAEEKIRKLARARDWRSATYTPLMNQGTFIGFIVCTRREPGMLADHHTQLLRTFADQAVIAIENARLFNETQEALERQTATADILKVIASSPSDVQPVFDAIAASANTLIGGLSTTVFTIVDNVMRLEAFTPTSPAADAALQASFPRPFAQRNRLSDLQAGRTAQIADTEIEYAGQTDLLEMSRLRGFRGMLLTPMLRDGNLIGTINVTRAKPGSFERHHVQLLRTFADQAVIAIENTRLFNETQEALERQTATADILKVIASSPSDVQPVFDAIAHSAKTLIGGFTAGVYRFIDGAAHLAAFTPLDPIADAALRASFPRPLSDDTPFRVAQTGEIFQVADTEGESDIKLKELARARGFRSLLLVPLKSNGISIGAIPVSRKNPGPFSAHHVQLLQTFADQAVIAIENTRLFNETKEALERQTATADILKVIASSPSDTTPVFNAIAASTKRLLSGFSVAVFRLVDGMVHVAAFTPVNPVADAALEADFPQPIEEFEAFKLAEHGQPLTVTDTETLSNERLRDIARLNGFRSMLWVPMVSGDLSIGIISVTRAQPGAFAPHHIRLLQTFADQAVIAIENTRLFNETQDALERQTATADILKVIASSPSDVQPVFDVIAAKAKQLIDGFSSAIWRFADDAVHLAAFTPIDTVADEALKSSFPVPVSRFPAYELVRNGAPAELPDTETEPAARDIAQARGFRSMLFAPLMNDGVAVGVITVTRTTTGSFGEPHTRLLQMFADQAVIAIKNVGLFNEVQARTDELSESLQQQTAVGDVLKTISRSTFDLQPVLDTLVNTAALLCTADMAFIMRRVGNEYRAGAAVGYTEAYIEFLSNHPLPVDRGTVTGRAVLERRPVQILDVAADPEYTLVETQSLASQRTTLGVPLLRENEPIGVIVLARQRVEAFTQKQIDLVTTFADQAVIAIENVRLFDELHHRTDDLSEALTYQTGSANILRVIASSPTDIKPVLDAIVESACALCGAYDAVLRLRKGDELEIGAHHGTVPADWNLSQINPRWTAGRAALQQRPVHVHDMSSSEGDEFPEAQARALEQGHRTILSVPLLQEGSSIGTLTLRRLEVNPFSESQIGLLQTFADEAVIAIGNVRLFEEVQAKTRDLSEALTYQTGSANILRVIASSPTDVQPVLTAIVENACKVCAANDAIVFLENDGELRSAAHHGPIPEGIATLPITPTRVAGQAFLERKPIHVRDIHSAEGEQFPDGQELGLRFGHRTMLAVPLLRDDKGLGVIVLRRNEVQPFSDEQIKALQTFADQAVIAIGNVRLFEEVQARTRELSEALTYQTGSSNILRVIASSPTDVKPVLDAIVESACELCDAYDAMLRLKNGDHLDFSAHHGPIPVVEDSIPISRNWTAGLAVVEQKTVHVHDLLSSDGDAFPGARERARRFDLRTILAVPLLREGESIGAIMLRRNEVMPFTDKQIALLQTFADQAVIAIGNVRLFEEVQARTRDLTESLQQQTATADVLQVISASPGELAPVFRAMLENAVGLCGAKFAMLLLNEGDQFRAADMWNLPAAYNEFLANNPIRVDPRMPLGRAVSTKQPVHVNDALLDQGYLDRHPSMVAVVELGGARTLLQVPMLQEDQLIGTIAVYRQEVRAFTDKQIALVENFAAQAVIAIENARLLNELRQRTSDLSKSLDDLRTAQDRLVQTEKLASLGQLTAGIAHEIKNPLNFVNNFAALSAELTEELNESLKPAELAEKLRAEVDELTGLLKSNLEKVVQHGKRADSIVRNMLLHSREGGGEHRPSDINALIDESLNLAYHGARAERPDFNVTLERDFDPAAGEIDLFPQEITRVILNMVSNGFYAVTKRRKDGDETGFEPTLRASTKNLGDTVEIRIRDNGTGIPADVKDKLFNPFFTTKPAGEGTGLGLSMSHDIIVKQHGGTIDVDTEQGHFTEFRIVLPRTSNFADKSRG